MKKFESLNGLDPWLWTMRCKAYLNVTLAPVRSGTMSHAWLVTGHHAVIHKAAPDEVPEVLMNAGFESSLIGDLEKEYEKVVLFSSEKHARMNLFMELIGTELGAEVNAILIGISSTDSCRTAEMKRFLKSHKALWIEPFREEDETTFVRDTGMAATEYLQRSRIEEARCEIMTGNASEGEILTAARRAGCWDSRQFLKLFLRFFAETPKEHHRRLSKVQKQLWDGIGLREKPYSSVRLMHNAVK